MSEQAVLRERQPLGHRARILQPTPPRRARCMRGSCGDRWRQRRATPERVRLNGADPASRVDKWRTPREVHTREVRDSNPRAPLRTCRKTALRERTKRAQDRAKSHDARTSRARPSSSARSACSSSRSGRRSLTRRTAAASSIIELAASSERCASRCSVCSSSPLKISEHARPSSNSLRNSASVTRLPARTARRRAFTGASSRWPRWENGRG
jgi:hypothetical protein